MKTFISSLILGLVGLLTAPAAFAQSSTHTPYQVSDYYAIDFGQWGVRSQTANTFLFQPGGLCSATAAGSTFFPFATNAPVLISDATPANSEVVTPSAVTNFQSQCGITVTPANSHLSFQLVSGTAGMQEALNAVATKGGLTTAYPAKIILDRNWWTVANSIPGKTATGILGAAAGNAHAFLVDNTTAGQTQYVWNGTAYAVGTWVNTLPTAAAGAAAGTAPTVGTKTGTALSLVQPLTTGTATTTGTLFTETWGASQFLYAPTCTVASIGANSFTAFTVATSYTTNAAVVTVTATSAPAVSTAYRFSVNCY